MMLEPVCRSSLNFSSLRNARSKATATHPPDLSRDEPPPGWARANPELALCLLYLAPRPGRMLEELFTR